MNKQLLIAGGGIGGMAAVLAASRAGWDIRWFERAPAFAHVGAGVQLGPNIVRHLDAWGLSAALRAVASFPSMLQVRSALSGQVLAHLDLGAHMQQRYGAAYATVHRADLHALLHNAAAQCADVDGHLRQAIERYTEADGVVRVHTSCEKTIEGDALLGADGLWSTVRQQMLADGLPQPTGHLAYRTLVDQQAMPASLRQQHITLWLGPALHVVHYPVRAGTALNLVVITHGTVPNDLRSWDHNANGADVRLALVGSCTALQDQVQAMIDSGPGLRLWPLCDRAPVPGPDAMVQGLVALLGDAAHPMPPYLAQGAGMAIEDACELQHALAQDALEVPLRLRRYALNRWQRNARVQARARRNGRIFHLSGVAAWARNTALRIGGHRLLDMPWLYGGGPEPRA